MEELNNRVVGYSTWHFRDASQLREDESEADRICDRTCWAKVCDAHSAFQLVVGQNIHTGEEAIFARLQIHTVMPESYNVPPQTK